MAKSKKYTTYVFESDSGWQADIRRRVTSKKHLLSKSKTGFATEAEAKTWAIRALQEFLDRLAKQSKQRAEKRAKDKEYDLI